MSGNFAPSRKTTTLEKDSNYWATSGVCFADATRLYGREFTIDVAAEPQTTKVSRYMLSPMHWEALTGLRNPSMPPVPVIKQQIREAELAGRVCVGFDALTTEWESDWWCNPPFDLKESFIRAGRKAQRQGFAGMMLLPYEPLTQWWRHSLARDVIVYEPDGRYQFVERDGATQKNGANFGSALVVFPTFPIGASLRVPFERGIGSKKKRGGVRWLK